MCKVSIVVPLYNVQSYIENFCLSLKKQTSQDFEVIFVNDGSTDKTEELLLKELEKATFKNKVVNQQNQGVSKARNEGLKITSGEYVSFCDPDDMLHEQYVECLSYCLDNTDCDIAICKTITISDNESYGEDILDKYDDKQPEKIVNKDILLREILYHRFVAGIWNLMIRRKLIDRNKLVFQEGYAYSEDLDFVYRSVCVSENIAITTKKLYLYRLRYNSAMRVFNNKRIDGLILFKELEGFFYNNNRDFYYEFSRYAIPYWIWSTIRQIAGLSVDYNDFLEKIVVFEPNLYLKKALNYPDLYVRLSSFLFLLNKRAFYFMSKFYERRKLVY